MAWNQPGRSNNNPWGKKSPSGGGDLDQAFKDWQKRIESLFGGGGGGRSSTPFLIILIIIVAAWMATGFYTIAPGSEGVVQRFGEHVQTVKNGWGWRLPWPIEMVTKVNTAALNSTSYKSSVLTAEPNMVELEVAVQFRIKNAEEYLFKMRDPEKTLSDVGESAIREVVGRNNLDSILESGRIIIAQNTRDTMQRTLDLYGAGLEVVSVNITGVQVPEPVQQSQSDSVKASAEKERLIKEAQAEANGLIPRAQGDAEKQIKEAEAYRAQIVAQATGDAARFSQVLSSYEKAPNVTRERMYLEAVESVYNGSRKVIIDSKSNGNMIYLPLDKLVDRARDADAAPAATRPTVTVEPDTGPQSDVRGRVDR